MLFVACLLCMSCHVSNLQGEMMEQILCMQDLEMGSTDGGGSKLHPVDRISGRRSGGQLVPWGLGLVGRDS